MRIKLDGFEHAVQVAPNYPIYEIKSDDELYGMYNAPELKVHRAINFNYHTWCLGILIYEVTTCEWQHYKLKSETFENWV